MKHVQGDDFCLCDACYEQTQAKCDAYKAALTPLELLDLELRIAWCVKPLRDLVARRTGEE